MQKNYRLFSIVCIIFMFFCAVCCCAEDIDFTETRLLNNVYRLVQQKDYKKARMVLEGYVNATNDVHPEVLKYMANVYILSKDFKRALSVLALLVSRGIEDENIHAMMASSLYEQKQFLSSATHFLTAYRLSSKKNIEYLYNAGVCYKLGGRNKNAYNILKRAIHLKMSNYNWIITYVSLLLELKKYKEALEYIVSLSNLDLKNKRYYQELRVQIYILLNNLSDAQNYLFNLLDDEPFEKKWWNYLVKIYLSQSRYKDALSVLLINGYIAPHTDQEKELIGDLYSQIDVPMYAINFYKDMSVKDNELYLKMVNVYLRLNNMQGALCLVNRICREKTSYKTCYLKGEILYRMKKYKDAESAFIDAAKHSMKNSRAYLMAGYCAFYGKRFDRARKYLLRAAQDKRMKKEVDGIWRVVCAQAGL